MKKITFCLLSISALFVFTTVNALACSCFGHPTDPDLVAAEIAEDFKSSTAVFSGEVLSVEYVPIVLKREGKEIKAERKIYKFKVDKLWKGSIGEEVVMPTSDIRYSDGSGSVGPNCIHNYFKVGKKYVVYAFGSIDKLESSVCGRTESIEEADTDIKELDKLRKENDDKQKGQKQ